MSVVGIDFGNDSCLVALARQGGIETVDNDYSLRATPSCVGFGERQRILGVAAKNQLVTNITNTVYDFKRFIGRNVEDIACRRLATGKAYKVVPAESGRAGVMVRYMGSERVFSMDQITAMLFTKLKQTTEDVTRVKITDCVISCPSFFTNTEREVLLLACHTAGLNVLRLLNDTTASALTYVFYRQDLADETEPPRNVVFVDCGHSSLQVFACAFSKGKLRMLATASDPNLGGRDFDNILAEHFIAEFKEKKNLNASTNKRALIRLMTEVEKLKKQMSANSTVLPLNIESFMNDVDVASSMCRADFEVLCAPLLERAESTMLECLQNSGLKLGDIHSVEIIGGSSRIAAIKQLIEKVFQKVPSTTLNQDEAVARGCAIQCAILSPTSRVRDISITDIQPYPIKLIFDPCIGSNGEMQLFPKFHPFPFTRMITLYRREPFTLSVDYESDIPYPSPCIGEYTVRNVTATPEGENTKVKIKTKLDMNGLFCVRSATAYERIEDIEVPAPVEEPMDIDNSNNNPNGPTPTNSTNPTEDVKMDSATTTTEEPAPPPEKVPEKPVVMVKKQQYKGINLPIDAISSSGITTLELVNQIEAENQMIMEDRKEKDRVDVKNALEEFIYTLRERLEREYSEFVTLKEKEERVAELGNLEEWLYGEGEDLERSAYSKKLDELKKFADGIKQKLDEINRKKLEEEEAKRNPPPPPQPAPEVSPTTEGSPTPNTTEPVTKEIPIQRE